MPISIEASKAAFIVAIVILLPLASGGGGGPTIDGREKLPENEFTEEMCHADLRAQEECQRQTRPPYSENESRDPCIYQWERRLSPDTDGDGVVDCDDPDDDNDGATDKLEDDLFGRLNNAHINRDIDADGFWDTNDLFPTVSSGSVAITIEFVTYEHDGDGCDPSPSPWQRADPYFGSLLITGLPGHTRDGMANEVVRGGWSLGSHIDERPSGPIDIAFTFSGLSQRPLDWGHANLGIYQLPHFGITAVLMDHDHFYHDVMDLSIGGDTAGTAGHFLTRDGLWGEVMHGGALCEGKFEVTFTDTAPASYAALAAAAQYASGRNRPATSEDWANIMTASGSP